MSQWFTKISKSLTKGKMSGETPVRPMKYPYTLSAKIMQFPYKFYYQNAWLIKYWMLGTLVCVPVFYKIQKLSYDPANVKKWEEIERRELYGGGHH